MRSVLMLLACAGMARGQEAFEGSWRVVLGDAPFQRITFAKGVIQFDVKAGEEWVRYSQDYAEWFDNSNVKGFRLERDSKFDPERPHQSKGGFGSHEYWIGTLEAPGVMRLLHLHYGTQGSKFGGRVDVITAERVTSKLESSSRQAVKTEVLAVWGFDPDGNAFAIISEDLPAGITLSATLLEDDE